MIRVRNMARLGVISFSEKFFKSLEIVYKDQVAVMVGACKTKSWIHRCASNIILLFI